MQLNYSSRTACSLMIHRSDALHNIHCNIVYKLCIILGIIIGVILGDILGNILGDILGSMQSIILCIKVSYNCYYFFTHFCTVHFAVKNGSECLLTK